MMSLSGEKGPYLGELPEGELEGTPETESGIAEVFELLRKRGMNDQQIIVEIFKRDINADVKEIMKITGMDSMDVGRLKGTVTRTKKKEAKTREKEEKKGEGGAHEEEGKGLLRGEVDANRILERILEHPDVPAKVKDDMMLIAQDTLGGVHPQSLVSYLLGYKGVSQNLANFLALRYNMALTKAQIEGRIQSWPINPSMMGMGQGSQFGGGGWGNQGLGPQPGFGGQPSPANQGWGPQPGGYGFGGYTERDILRLRQDWDKERKLENLERSLTDLVKDLPNTIRNALPQVAEGQYEEVTEYVDKKGDLVDPEKAISVRMIRKPIAAAPRESTEVRELKDHLLSLEKTINENANKNLLDRIAKLSDDIAEMKKSPEESPELKEIRAQLEHTRLTLSEMKETMATKEKEVLLNRIDGLEDRISSYSRTAGEWKTDEAKLIASELGEIGSIVKEIAKKDRMGLIREIIIPESSQPPTAAAPEEARGGVIDELRKHGFTAKIIER